MKKKRGLFLWLLLFIFLTTYNFDLPKNIESSILPIKKINLTGINNSDENKIKKKLEEFKGKSIIFINTKGLKETIKDFNFIREIKIKKIYPDSIRVEVKEFKPLGVFVDNNSQRHLLLEEGKVIKNHKLTEKDLLPLVYGNGAEKNFYLLQSSLENLNFNKELIKSFNYFDINRWDIVLKDDKTIRLPAEGYEEALRKFISIYKKENFSKFEIFDFRIKEQLILK